jgi:hypothetical protein
MRADMLLVSTCVLVIRSEPLTLLTIVAITDHSIRSFAQFLRFLSAGTMRIAQR